MAQSVRNKTALVTGAGSGINLAFASALLRKGCNVILADLALRPEAQRVVDAHPPCSATPTTTDPSNVAPGAAVFVQTDVRSWPQLERAFAAAPTHFPGAPLTLVCPGAGVYEPASSSFWRPPGTAAGSGDDPGAPSRYALLDVNVVHPIRAAQMALARWLNDEPPTTPAGPKTLLLVSSTSAQTTSLATPLYDASKHAISGFVRALAGLQDAVGVRVVAVAPGLVRTPLYTDDAEKLAMVDEARDVWVEPEEVAEVMCALVEREGMGGVVGMYAGEGQEGEEDIKIEGGTVVEVTKGRARAVMPFNDPGPSGPGTAASNMGEAERKVKAMLKKGWGC